MRKAEVLAPAGNLASLKAAMDAGADAVYLGFNDETNARNFEGLNFTDEDLVEAKKYAKKKKAKINVAINTFPELDKFDDWKRAVDRAVEFGADALILADLGVLRYARATYPDINIHLSVQASSSNHESINFYKKQFNIQRVILPRVVTVDEIKEICDNTDVEIELFALGGVCINIEGRCYLSSFVTGASTNTEGACSPSRFVKFENFAENGVEGNLSIKLNGLTLNKLGPDEPSPYPTLCKARYIGPDGDVTYAMEDPESLNVIEMLPSMLSLGVSSLKIEGRQRTKAYVSQMTKTLREAVDNCYDDKGNFIVQDNWKEDTNITFEGSSSTPGSYLSK